MAERSAPVYSEHCVESTNTWLKELADKGAESGTVVTADMQLGGRGRQGRSFLSPEGGLYMSMLLRPDCDLQHCTELTPLAAVAAHRALKACTGLHADIKWPNDLLLNGKKLCGILTELSIDPQGKPQIIIGIGINLNTTAFPPELEDIACSVFSATGIEVKKESLLEKLVAELDEYIARWEREGCFFLEEYRELCICKERDVLVVSGSESRKARALGIEEDFSLRVCYEDETEECLFYGEISLKI